MDAKDERKVNSLENKISYWETHLESRRTQINKMVDNHLSDGMSDTKRGHWEGKRTEMLDHINELEQKRLEPLRVEYRRLMGLDDE